MSEVMKSFRARKDIKILQARFIAGIRAKNGRDAVAGFWRILYVGDSEVSFY